MIAVVLSWGVQMSISLLIQDCYMYFSHSIINSIHVTHCLGVLGYPMMRLGWVNIIMIITVCNVIIIGLLLVSTCIMYSCYSVCACACVCLCVYACVSVCALMCISSACTYVCSVCVSVCIHTYVHAHTLVV